MAAVFSVFTKGIHRNNCDV